MAKPKLTPTQASIQNPSLSPEELLIKTAKEQFDSSQDHWGKFRDSAKDSLRYVEDNGAYMDQNYVNQRRSSGLPTLTTNRIKTFLNNLTSEARQNIPGIQVDPANDKTDPKFAEMVADLIRTIQQDSKAKMAYQNAAWYSIGVGLGYVRVKSEYEGSDSFEQRLCIENIADPASVFLDPNHKAVDGSDCRYAFIVADLSHDEYLAKYGKGKMATALEDAKIHGWNQVSRKKDNNWLTKNTVRVAEYYVKESYTQRIYQVMDRRTGAIEVVTEMKDYHEKLNDRVVDKYIVKHYVINDKEILEESEWPGDLIPIVAFKGLEFWNNGERKLSGVIQPMRDVQKKLDWYQNWQAEMVMLSTKAPFIGTPVMFENNQHEWANAHVTNPAYLTFARDPLAPEDKPFMATANLPIQMVDTLVSQSIQDLQSIGGGIDPMARNPQGVQQAESGRALLVRNESARTQTFVFQDNIRESIAQVGRILIQAIPSYYLETGRNLALQKITGENYHASFNDHPERMLEDAKFSIAIESGASYATKRQEAMDAQMQLIGVYPQAAPLIADIVVSNADWPGHTEVAARLRAAVPPQVLEASQPMDPQQAETMVPQLKAQVSSLQQQMGKMQTEIQPDKNKIQKLEMELAMEKNDNQLETVKVQHEYKIHQDKLQLEQEKIIVEAEIKKEELALEREKIQLQRDQLKINATVAAADISSDTMEHHHKVTKAIREDAMAKDATTSEENDMDDISDLK